MKTWRLLYIIIHSYKGKYDIGQMSRQHCSLSGHLPVGMILLRRCYTNSIQCYVIKCQLHVICHVIIPANTVQSVIPLNKLRLAGEEFGICTWNRQTIV